MVCPVQQRCGGCPNLPLSRQDELSAKVTRVHQEFERFGLVAPVRACIVGRDRSGYRNRLRMKVADGKVDLFNQAKEHGCVVLRPELWEGIEQLRTVTHADPTLLQGAAHVEVRVDDYGHTGMSVVVLDGFEINVVRLQSKLGSTWRIADRFGGDQPVLSYDIAPGIVNQVPVNAFVQVNSEVNQLLVAHVRSVVSAAVSTVGAGSFIDLYSGAGNLTLPLLADGLAGTAVERNGSGSAALRKQTKSRNVTVLTGDVHARLGELTQADVVITNPARSGIKTGHEQVASLVSKAMVCVGCEPGALAFDAAQLVGHGLAITGIQTFDMFPGTNHIETVVTLARP